MAGGGAENSKADRNQSVAIPPAPAAEGYENEFPEPTKEKASKGRGKKNNGNSNNNGSNKPITSSQRNTRSSSQLSPDDFDIDGTKNKVK